MSLKKDRPLTEKQKLFVRELVFNRATQGQAYKRAFGSVKYADSKACRLLKKSSIINYKNNLSQKLEEKSASNGLWNLEIATHHFLWILNEAIEDMENNGLTMPAVVGCIKSLKSLDKLYGLNKPPATNIRPNIVFIGENEITK
jgi:hypothetical protein